MTGAGLRGGPGGLFFSYPRSQLLAERIPRVRAVEA